MGVSRHVLGCNFIYFYKKMFSQRSEITAIDNEMSNYKNYFEEPNIFCVCSELIIKSFAMTSRSRKSVISL